MGSELVTDDFELVYDAGYYHRALIAPETTDEAYDYDFSSYVADVFS